MNRKKKNGELVVDVYWDEFFDFPIPQKIIDTEEEYAYGSFYRSDIDINFPFVYIYIVINNILSDNFFEVKLYLEKNNEIRILEGELKNSKISKFVELEHKLLRQQPSIYLKTGPDNKVSIFIKQHSLFIYSELMHYFKKKLEHFLNSF